MAAFDLQEQERIAELKAWWAKWGLTVSLALIAVVVGYLGNYGWHAYRKSQGEGATDAYSQVEKAYKDKDAAKTRTAADAMVSQYGSHALAARAMLLAAKSAFDANDLEHAKTALQWVAGNAKEDAVADIASLRLAAVLMDQKQYDAALKAVGTSKSISYGPLFADARGDAYALKGDAADAKKAYQEAIGKLDKDSSQRRLIETKQSALGV